MSQKNDFSQLVVQRLPDTGILVRFRSRRLILENHVAQAREEMLSLVAPERLMLVDLTNVEYLSSATMGVLLSTQRALRRVAGNMSLCGLKPDINEVFRICKLDRTFEIYPDLESALGGGPADEQ